MCWGGSKTGESRDSVWSVQTVCCLLVVFWSFWVWFWDTGLWENYLASASQSATQIQWAQWRMRHSRARSGYCRVCVEGCSPACVWGTCEPEPYTVPAPHSTHCPCGRWEREGETRAAGRWGAPEKLSRCSPIRCWTNDSKYGFLWSFSALKTQILLCRPKETKTKEQWAPWRHSFAPCWRKHRPSSGEHTGRVGPCDDMSAHLDSPSENTRTPARKS